MSRKILVLGGTGAMGRPLVKILSEKGDHIYVTSRRSRKDTDRVSYIQGNALDDIFLESILHQMDWDTIIDFMVYPTEKFSKRIDTLTSAARQYIFISSCRVFADHDKLITERSPRLLDVSKDEMYLKTDEYSLRKAREENILRNYPNVTIVRPSVTFNDDRLQLGVYEASDWIDRVQHDKTIVFSKDIAAHYTTLTHGEDVAYGIAGLIGNPKAIGEDFNIVTNEAFTWQQVLDIYLETLRKNGFNPKVIYTEKALNLRIPKWQYQVKYARLFDRRFNNSKIREAVPELVFRDVRKSLENCFEQYLKRNNKSLTLSSVSIIQDREAGDICKVSDFSSIKQYLKYLVLRFMPYSMLLDKIEGR